MAVQGISKRFGRKIAAAGVTLTVRAGEICGFVGANGSDKTTTLRVLAGILRPESGHVHLLGFDLSRDAARIRGQVGYMSQRLSLYAELSVLENLRFRAAVYGLRNPVAWRKPQSASSTWRSGPIARQVPFWRLGATVASIDRNHCI